MSEWTIILKAAEAAARWHARQTKKRGAQDPYINHLLEVAALLHDAIEDQEVPREMIAQEFGEDATKLVEELTDNMAVPEQERRQRQVAHARTLSDRAKLIKLADKISNLKKVSNPPPDWTVKRRLEYLAWTRQVVAGLQGVNARLEEVFDHTAARAEASLRPNSIVGPN